MEKSQVSILKYNLEQHAQKLNYQTPIITELHANELTQSAAQIMSESNEGYYS